MAAIDVFALLITLLFLSNAKVINRRPGPLGVGPSDNGAAHQVIACARRAARWYGIFAIGLSLSAACAAASSSLDSAILVGVLGLLSCSFCYRRLRQYERLLSSIATERAELDCEDALHLRSTLIELVRSNKSSVRDLAELSLTQLNQMQKGVLSAERTLSERLVQGELTHSRHLQAVLKAKKTVLDNLCVATAMIRNISSKSTEHAFRTRAIMQQLMRGTESEVRDEISGVYHYQHLFRQHRELALLFAENESAITAINELDAQWSGVRMLVGRSLSLTEHVVAELAQAADQAGTRRRRSRSANYPRTVERICNERSK